MCVSPATCSSLFANWLQNIFREHYLLSGLSTSFYQIRWEEAWQIHSFTRSVNLWEKPLYRQAKAKIELVTMRTRIIM